MSKFKVNIMTKDQGSFEVIIEANNPPQARQFAQGRYAGATVGSANQIGG